MTKNDINTIHKTNNKITLLPHNQKMFDEIMELINNGEHSVFFSEATGLGKSFIFMALVNELFKGKKVLYIVPKIAIYKSATIYKEFEYIKDYVDMATYADFNTSKIRHYDYDAIFVDECHHLISNIQGANIIKTMKGYLADERYVFGFTATPEIKYRTKTVNVGDYFNSKVLGMDIVGAIEAGVFRKIEYAIADYDTIIDEEKYRKRYSIDGTKTLLENIIAERSDITRWLVYFSNIKSLKENLYSIERLFPDFKIFIMHSKNKNSMRQFEEFNSYKGKTMLISVSMVLEGIHPKNVGGILLYRNITRYNTFLQVLGRICDINTTRSPLCVDITNCVYNIPYSYISELINEEEGDDKRKRSLNPIIDVKASSYRYIELLIELHNTTTKEYKGYTWKSYLDLSKQLGYRTNYVSHLLNKGKYNSCEEIIDAKLNGELREGVISNGGSYKGYTWKSYLDLSKQLGCSTSSLCRLLKLGRYNSCEEIIDAVLSGELYGTNTYKGYTWKNNVDLSKQLGHSESYVPNLLNKGKYNSCEEIIDAKLNGELRERVISNGGSYKGYTWKSYLDLSKQLGFYRGFVRNLLNKGKYNSCEEIIDAKLNGEF